MARGPVKTDAEKILRGKFGKEPVPQSSLKRKAPKCPKHLNDDAKECWRKLAPKLERMGLISELDEISFMILCIIYSRLKSTQMFIDKENPSLMQVIEKPLPDGNTTKEAKTSPYVVNERQYMAEYRHYAAMFGLSPRGRTGLTLKGKKGDDDFGDLLD